jgi:hypothetical protein
LTDSKRRIELLKTRARPTGGGVHARAGSAMRMLTRPAARDDDCVAPTGEGLPQLLACS